MKKLFTTCLFTSLLLVGCASSTNTSSTSSTAPAKEKLTVATSPDYPPLEFLDNNGKVVGADITLANYIGEKLGMEVSIETMDFNAVLTSVDTGKVLLGISGFGYKKDRAENFELSIGYNNGENSESSCHGLIVKKELVDSYKTLDDFAGKTIAVQSSSLQQMYVEDQIKNPNIEIVTSLDQAILSLQTNKVDAVALSCDIAKGYANSLPDVAKAEPNFDLSQYEEYAGNVVVAKKGNTELINKVNEILKEVNEKGLYDQWVAEAKQQAKEAGITFEE